MPFCPRCRDEFEDWVETCPDCRVRLVAELRVETEPTPSPGHAWRHTRPARAKDELVQFASASSETEARMWAGVLEDKGIRTMVKTYGGGGFRYPPVSSIIQPSNLQFDVYVLESDLKRAREVLGRIDDTDALMESVHGRRAESAGPEAELVLVAIPSTHEEAQMWAGMLEHDGIQSVIKGCSPRSTDRPQIHVLRSDEGKARRILGRIPGALAVAEPPFSQAVERPAKDRRLSTTAAGIVDIVDGALYLGLSVGLGVMTSLHPAVPIAAAAIGVLAMVGGVCTLLRRNWWIAVAGAVVSMVPFFPLFLMSGSRDEFE
jgi:hypothetical protein